VENPRKAEIISSCLKLFIKYGIKSVTMDDIARELGMSKKTLYVFFKDKNELIMQVMQSVLSFHKIQTKNILKSQHNAIDESFEIFSLNTRELSEVKPALLFELKKYYPDAWKLHDDFKNNFMFSSLMTNLEKGKKEGLYRKQINTKIISIAYSNMINSILESESYSDKEFNFGALYNELFYYHIRGIASEKGMEYIDQKMKKIDTQKK
jgi:AcrR family transcriptional regulator